MYYKLICLKTFLGTPPQTISQKIRFRNDKHFSVFGENKQIFGMNKKKNISIRVWTIRVRTLVSTGTTLTKTTFKWLNRKGNMMHNAKGQWEQQDLRQIQLYSWICDQEKWNIWQIYSAPCLSSPLFNFQHELWRKMTTTDGLYSPPVFVISCYFTLFEIFT